MLVALYGNICRSPFAAALLTAQMPRAEVRSAGLHAADGHAADATAIRCAERMGVSLAAHRSQRVGEELLAWADLVLVMQGAHAAAIEREWPRFHARVRLLGDFLPQAALRAAGSVGREADAVFERVFGRLAQASLSLAARIEAGR